MLLSFVVIQFNSNFAGCNLLYCWLVLCCTGWLFFVAIIQSLHRLYLIYALEFKRQTFHELWISCLPFVWNYHLSTHVWDLSLLNIETFLVLSSFKFPFLTTWFGLLPAASLITCRPGRVSVKVQATKVKGQGSSASANEISRIMDMPAAMALLCPSTCPRSESYAWKNTQKEEGWIETEWMKGI